MKDNIDKNKANATLTHAVDLVVGDWSGDGHNQKRTFTVRCNLTKDELFNAYRLGTGIVGLDITADVAGDYMDDRLSHEHALMLERGGMVLEETLFNVDDFNHPDRGGCLLEGEDFARIWMFIAWKGNPSLEHEFTSNDELEIGGYGLFS